MSGTGTKVCTGILGTGIDVVPNLPNVPVPVLMSHRTYRFSGTDIDAVPNLPKRPVLVRKSVPVPGNGTGTGTHLNTYTGNTGGKYRRQGTGTHLRLGT